MFLFGRTRKPAGWLATQFQDGGILAAIVERPPAALPIVQAVLAYAEPKSMPVAMVQLAKELHADHRYCTTVLKAGEYQMLAVDAPNVPPEELKTAIRWRLKDMLDFHIDDAAIDLLDVPANKSAPVRNHAIYVVAARNQLIEKRQALFAEAGIPLTVIDIPDIAQRNISTLAEPEGRGLAMLSFDADGGLLTVTYAGELYLSRRIDVPLAQLLDENADDKAGVYDRITLELQRSLDHFDRQYHFITVSKLIVSPLPAKAQGLLDYLASNLYLQVDNLDLGSVLDISRVPELKSQAQQQRFLTVIGAALRHEETGL